MLVLGSLIRYHVAVLLRLPLFSRFTIPSSHVYRFPSSYIPLSSLVIFPPLLNLHVFPAIEHGILLILFYS